MAAIIPLRARTLAERLEGICRRLIVLLNESDDPEGEMGQVLGTLEEHDLWHGDMDPASLDRGTPRFHAFAWNLIVENEAIRRAVEETSREFQPLYCETIEDLISNLLPGRVA